MPVISFIYGDTKEDIADPERVMRKIVEQYNLKRDGIFHGERHRENEARKMAMYLMKRCGDRTLPEIAKYFGTNGYATVSWNCRVVESRMAKEMKFKDRIEKFAASI